MLIDEGVAKEAVKMIGDVLDEAINQDLLGKMACVFALARHELEGRGFTREEAVDIIKNMKVGGR